MNASRREFLSGAAAIAFGGWRLFSAPPGWKHGGTPDLVFGVVSDTHLRTRRGSSGKLGTSWPDKYFAASLRYFKSQNVDAVVHCGDMAHRGQVEEMRFHANVWHKVFGEQGPVKLFVTGNHDKDGSDYGGFVAGKYPDPEERAKHVLATDMAGNWERIWGEKYEPVWRKEVKGYHFFGCNWGVDRGELANLINASAGTCELDKGTKPFFVLTHARPDSAFLKAVRPSSNAFSFFGHNHWSIANWNIPTLYCETFPCIQCASCEPRGCASLVSDSYISKAKIEGREAAGKGRQGFVVRVYDDMLVIERREFGEGGSLGADWVMPFNWETGKHPFSKDELKKVIGEPQFGKSVELKVESVKSESGEDVVKILIPLADGNPDSRVYAYEVVVAGDEGTRKLHKAVYAAGCNMGIGHEPNGGMTTLDVPKSELPPGKTLTFAVRPLTSLGTSGKAIATEFKA